MKLSQGPGASGARLDEERVRSAALGDAQAWSQLVSSYEREVWELALGRTGRVDEAAQVCELVWRQLVDSLTELGDEPVHRWLLRMTHALSERACRRAGHRDGEPAVTERRQLPRTTAS